MNALHQTVIPAVGTAPLDRLLDQLDTATALERLAPLGALTPPAEPADPRRGVLDGRTGDPVLRPLPAHARRVAPGPHAPALWLHHRVTGRPVWSLIPALPAGSEGHEPAASAAARSAASTAPPPPPS